ncbi:MAG: hypothetical protein OXB95_08285 [Rhodobacteraceae bacterium]|nr:hypothetical protein [Paracoccaceae bacterium]
MRSIDRNRCGLACADRSRILQNVWSAFEAPSDLAASFEVRQDFNLVDGAGSSIPLNGCVR